MNCLRSMDFPRARELRLPEVVVRRKEEPHYHSKSCSLKFNISFLFMLNKFELHSMFIIIFSFNKHQRLYLCILLCFRQLKLFQYSIQGKGNVNLYLPCFSTFNFTKFKQNPDSFFFIFQSMSSIQFP